MVSLRQILDKIGIKDFIGDNSVLVKDIVPFDARSMRSDVISWCSDKNIDSLKYCEGGTIICSEKAKEHLNKNCNYIIVQNPRQVFAQVLRSFFIPPEEPYRISEKSSVHPSVKMGENVFVGDFTVIEKDCVIGSDTYIGSNNVIHARTIIGSHVKMGSNNTIGGIGFGYEKDEAGSYEVLPHLGNVRIHDKVEIGNNTCIDRAVLGSTIINRNVKLDNLVHIAHGVVIGENSLIIAHAMVGGSSHIGKNVWVAPGALIINKGMVEDDSLIGMGAVVVKKVDKGTVVAGNPAKYLKNT